MSNARLIGCIDKMKRNRIYTRFFYLDLEKEQVREVTEELCHAIHAFNDMANTVNQRGRYSMVIPYTYQDDVAVYAFGSGLSHYLQGDVFQDIYDATDEMMSFPLPDCILEMYTPNDVGDILGITSSGIDMKQQLLNRYI